MNDRDASRLRLWLRRYAALIRSAWLVDFQYRATIAIWLIWGITEPVIALGIWWSIAAGGSVQGYSRSDFARYFFGVTLVNQLTLAWDAWYIDRWIREGEMNFRLARPIAPVHEAIADNLAYKMRTATIILLVWLLAAAVWPAVRIPFAPGRWVLATIAVILAAGIRFLNGYATGLLAFWTTRATALMELQFGVSLFLSGRVAPLALLPPAVGAVAAALWFPYMLAFPVDVLTGAAATSGAYLRGFAGQVVWLVVWFVAYRLIWRYGLRRYGAVGG
jgi:ABC-2 type transport system permease protein